ncbi:MAG: TonB-dependent receptor [Prevotella sp.]|nr:TonB-dependent receptor [Prevotella sp.]
MYKPVFQKREVIVFRQFQRKGYSLFACLGREVLISVLSVATLSATKAASISDETWRVDSTKATKEIWLDDVAVTGSRAPLTKSQAARMVTVLSREDIAQAPVQSINDLLKYAVGVDVRQRGPLGSQTDISVRGGTQEQITILLNGINICDPQTGHNVLDLPVQLSEIVRIEVLEGPAGRVYGTSSLVGAINIVTTSTTQQDKGSLDVEAEGGSFGYAKAGLVARLGTTHFRHSLSGSYARSDGFSRAASGSLNTDFSGSKAFYQGGYDDEQVRLSWHAGLADKGWGSGTFYASPRWQADDQYEHTTKFFTAIQGENKRGAIHFQPAIYWNQNRDRYEGYRGQADKMKYNYNRCDVYGLKLNSYFDWQLGRTAFGAELRNEDLVSGNLGEPLSQTHHISGTDRDYTLGINRTNISAHLEHNILLDRLTLSAGFVAAKSSWSNMNMSIYPGIDASYRLGDRWKVFASYNSSLRLPSFTEMYYKLQGYAADPHLKPEEMQALEGGVQYHSPALEAKATVWHHHGKDMIDWIMDTRLGDQAEWQSVNHTKINSIGLEANVGVDFKRLFHSPLSTLRVSYSYIDQDKDLETGIVSQYALEYLKHKLVANLQVDIWRQLTLGLNLRWQDRTGQYTDFLGEAHDYRPFALMDARLNWTADRYTLFAEVNNVLDNRSYVDYGNVPQPGAWLVVGGRWSLRF